MEKRDNAKTSELVSFKLVSLMASSYLIALFPGSYNFWFVFKDPKITPLLTEYCLSKQEVLY